MQVLPTKAVRRIRREGSTPYEIAAKVVAFTSLLAHAFLDQKVRPREKAKPTRAGARRVIQTKSARRARLSALALLHDRARDEEQKDLGRKLLNRLLKIGGLTALADVPGSDSLIEAFRLRRKEVSYVVAIVDYLLRSHVYPDDGIPSTIEDAKGFVWSESAEWSVSKIAKAWETYKLTAPYLYALQLEKSFQKSEIEDADEILDWAIAFVKSTRRLERFLGHAAFAMDVLKLHARDQRERDLVGVVRILPLLRRFDEDEKNVSAAIDRKAANYGQSWNAENLPDE